MNPRSSLPSLAVGLVFAALYARFLFLLVFGRLLNPVGSFEWTMLGLQGAKTIAVVSAKESRKFKDEDVILVMGVDLSTLPVWVLLGLVTQDPVFAQLWNMTFLSWVGGLALFLTPYLILRTTLYLRGSFRLAVAVPSCFSMLGLLLSAELVSFSTGAKFSLTGFGGAVLNGILGLASSARAPDLLDLTATVTVFVAVVLFATLGEAAREARLTNGVLLLSAIASLAVSSVDWRFGSFALLPVLFAVPTVSLVGVTWWFSRAR
jgi:hypothetical protein